MPWDKVRKTLTTEKMSIAKLPDTPQFMTWWNGMLEHVASCFIDPASALAFCKQCEIRPVSDEEIDNPSRFYAALDAKWASALQTIITGTIAADVINYQAKRMSAGSLMSGRRKAVIIWDHYQTSANRGGMYSYENLAAVAIKGQDVLDFSKRWRQVNQGLKADVPEDIRRSLLYKQLNGVAKLNFYLEIY